MIARDCQNANWILNEYIRTISFDPIGFTIHYWGLSPEHQDNPYHQHSFFELCYCESGEGIYIEGGQRYAFGPGDLYCSRPGIVHRIAEQRNVSLWFVAFEPSHDWRQNDQHGSFYQLLEQPILLVRPDNSVFIEVWKNIIQFASKTGTSSTQTLLHMAASLLTMVPSLFLPSVAQSIHRPPRKNRSIPLRQAELFIQDNLNHPLRLEDVAKYVHISGRHLSRLFEQTHRQTFTDYVRDRRIRKASDYLLHSSLSMKEIAEICGFRSVHYFTKMFTQLVGMPPGKYRSGRGFH